MLSRVTKYNDDVTPKNKEQQHSCVTKNLLCLPSDDGTALVSAWIKDNLLSHDFLEITWLFVRLIILASLCAVGGAADCFGASTWPKLVGWMSGGVTEVN